MPHTTRERFIEIVKEIRHKTGVRATDEKFYKKLINAKYQTFVLIENGRNPTYAQLVALATNDMIPVNLDYLFGGVPPMFKSNEPKQIDLDGDTLNKVLEIVKIMQK